MTEYPNGKGMTKTALRKVFAEAHAAGMAAGKGHSPTPMVVQQHASAFNDNSPVVKEWFVGDGVCGFAWVNLRPGNSRAANFAKKNLGAHKDYYGGVSIWCHEFGQSMERKQAYARAYASVLFRHGIYAHAQSRMD